jgi:hypothetical protein
MAFMLLLLCVSAPHVSAQSSSLVRDRDPVVILGSQLQALLNLPPDEIVAFKYQGGWQQIPVQLDERKYVEYRTVYNTDLLPAGFGTVAFADSTTYTGPDVDPAFDDDDELVFMARDTGDCAPAAADLPSGVQPGSGVEVTVTDGLDGGMAFVYCFRTDGTLSSDADADYVTYIFRLDAGSYIPNYNTETGPNPEDSEAFSPYYRTHFADRWIRDELNVLTDGSSGVDILDRHKNMFAPGNCVRTENTFSAGEGAFFTNKDGPVRAIRSYMGANSGPLTQREHLFYEQRQDIATFLRVHAISGVMDLYDYSPDAIGMSYFNNLNTAGVVVNGVPDVVVDGPIVWEMVSGPQGSLIIADIVQTDIDPFTYTSYYLDDASPSVTQCTGDAFAYATSGVWIDQAIPNTDPLGGQHNQLSARRVVYYETPGQTVATAELRSAQAQTPLQFSTVAYPPAPGDLDRDTDVDQDDFGEFQVCLTGPAIPQTDPACSDADFDRDGDVDLSDFGLLQRCLSGPDIPANPDCAD